AASIHPSSFPALPLNIQPRPRLPRQGVLLAILARLFLGVALGIADRLHRLKLEDHGLLRRSVHGIALPLLGGFGALGLAGRGERAAEGGGEDRHTSGIGGSARQAAPKRCKPSPSRRRHPHTAPSVPAIGPISSASLRVSEALAAGAFAMAESPAGRATPAS